MQIIIEIWDRRLLSCDSRLIERKTFRRTIDANDFILTWQHRKRDNPTAYKNYTIERTWEHRENTIA